MKELDMISRRCVEWIYTFIALIVLFHTAACAAEKAGNRPPNVVMILADDQGWGDLSVHGNTDLSTPHIDSLSRDGAAFDRFYVCAVCSPTRAEMLTGRYHTRLGVMKTSRGGERLNLGEKTIGDTFKAAGYATGCFGKWHNGLQWPYHPNARGFDEYYGFCSGHWGHYFSPTLEHNGKLVRGDGYLTDDLTHHAMTFIEKNKDKPFFCYLPLNIPHSPMQVPDKYWKKFENMELKKQAPGARANRIQHTRAALAMCENIDWNVGRLLARLDELDLARNTIVIYFSDNGPNGRRWNGGMRGIKGSTDEGGVRSPFFIRWPGRIKPGMKVKPIAGAIDLLPTLADLAGIPLVSEKKLDGVSLKPLLFDPDVDWPDRLYFNAWQGRFSVRSQQYRLDHRGRLYDMRADPGQQRDITKQEPDIAARLKTALAKWKEDAVKPVPDRPFTVGHPGAAVTHLPARDGISHGTIQRSSPHPNDSFFFNWTDEKDSITWDIEVLTAGRYEAQLHYTCRTEDVGVKMQLSFADSETQSAITEAHDPPLLGAAHDRFERGEGYVKAFKPVSLGTLHLKKQRGTLTLRATDIPGKQAVDVRYVVLTRLP